ncbi:hypothetical protein [Cardiobacterium hominis]
MNYKNNAMFIAARNGRPASAMVSVLRPRVSLDVDLLNTLDAEEIRLWMLCQAMQQGRGHITPDQRQIASILNTTQSTISRRLKTLRALRYLALLPGRAKNIRERQSYIVYSQPASIETVLLVDQHYLIFLQDESRKGGSRLRQLCKDELFALPRDQYELYLALPADASASEEDAGTITDEGVPQTISLPLCTPASRGEEAESPLCTAASRSEEAESPLCTAASRDEEAESPLCTPASRGEKRGDIYNRARMHPRVHTRTPTHRGIKNKVFNNNQTSLDGGCGGKVCKKFAYFAQDYFAELLDRLHAKYGKRTTHAVCNLLKQGSYEMDGTVFRHQTDEEDAAIVLMSLLDQAVKVPQRYVTKLLYRAHLGELTYVGDQHQRLNDIRQMLADAAWREQLEALHIADGSVLTNAHGNACLVEQQRLQGNAPAWHGRAVEDIKPAVLRGEWQIAPADTAHALREQLLQSAAEEQRKNEDFWQDVQNLLHPGRASNV